MNIIVKKYERKHPEVYDHLKSHICCEPLPCPVYCLPKDHKQRVLKGRPIHAAIDSPATSLSKCIAKSLHSLLKYVQAHLKNTDEFINSLSDIDCEIKGFCSLDACNLYGSIPLEDINSITPGIFTVAKRFFNKYKAESILSPLSDKDFEALLRLCLTSDTVLIDGKGYKQRSGLAMGNNLAPVLAIIYMNELDAQIIQSTNAHLFLKRLIDDIFLAWTSESVTGDMLLSMANNLNDAIKFTIESPTNNQLPYLDTLVSFDSTTNTFSTTLYVKPIHSTCITLWDSHGSIPSKRSVLIGEVRRAISRSTDSTERNKSLRKITSIFTSNGYPKQFVRSVIQKTLYTEPQRDNQEGCIYLKLPYIDEVFKRSALATTLLISRSYFNSTIGVKTTQLGRVKIMEKNLLPK